MKIKCLFGRHTWGRIFQHPRWVKPFDNYVAYIKCIGCNKHLKLTAMAGESRHDLKQDFKNISRDKMLSEIEQIRNKSDPYEGV